MWNRGRTLSVHLSRGQDPAQPDFWVAASSRPARQIFLSVSEPRPTPASFPQLSADLRGVPCSFPWRRSVGRSRRLAGADNSVWKDRRYLSCRLEAGAPFLSGLPAALGTVRSQPPPPPAGPELISRLANPSLKTTPMSAFFTFFSSFKRRGDINSLS